MDKDNNRSIYRARKLIKNVLTQVIDNPKNPDFLNFFHADTYRFYFLMSFMWEYLEGNEYLKNMLFLLSQKNMHPE